MDFSLAALLSQLWPLAIAAIVVGFLVVRGRRKASISNNQMDAARHGMNYAAPGSDAGVVGIDDGNHRFSGQTKGFDWVAEAVRLASEVDDGQATRRMNALSYTRWTAPGFASGDGTLLLMNLPKGTEAPAAATGDGGLLAKLAEKAGTAALDIYLRQRFGGERAQAAQLSASQRAVIERDHFGRGFAVWCDRPELLARLSSPARDALADAHDTGIAVLWDAHGLTLHWPTARTQASEVEACADFGARLAGLLDNA